jgi:hypothetical protein
VFGWLKGYSGTYHWKISGDWALSAGERRNDEWVNVPVAELFADTDLLARRLEEAGVPVTKVWIDDDICRFTPADRDANLRIEKRRVKSVLSEFYGRYKGRRIGWSFHITQYD